MRLTLRTLLAYMDNILSPEDSQAIGKRVEESEFASTLLHRVRDCMRRLRLGAPAVMDQGKGLDPNTVAEYLDNTLPADGVADFERVCLESDVHLAEVASCHQILTMVLGEPAEVDPDSRVRMYGLAEQAAVSAPPELPREAPEPDGRKGAPPVQRETAPARHKPELPDYLRAAQAQRRRMRLVLAVILLLAVMAGVLAIPGPRNALLGMLGRGPTAEPPVEQPSPEGIQEPAPPSTITPEPEPAEKPTEDAPVEPPAPAAQTPSAPGPAAPPETAVDEVPAPQPSGTPGAPASPVSPEPEEMASLPADAAPAVPLDQPDMMPPGELPSEPEAKPAPLPPEPVGKLASPTDVLLKRDPESGAWWRVEHPSPLVSGDAFLALPTYRPRIILDKGLDLTLVDSTRIELLPADADGLAGVDTSYGRLLIRPAEQPQAQLRLKIGGRVGLITLGDADSAMAIEVGRRGPSTSDPETEPGPLAASLYAVSGKFTWKDLPMGDAVVLTSPAQILIDQSRESPLEVAPVEALPPWVASSTVGALDQRASGTVEADLSADRPAELTLTELSEHRQREVRRLALRSLAAIGSFGPLVDALDDSEVRMVWPDYYCIDLLRTAIAQSPKAASQVRAEMEDAFPGEGAELYEMLWRYGPDGLSRLDGERLVGFLEHESLAFRRLAFWNLRRITGMGLYYSPDDTAAKRRPAVLKWKERIGDIQPPEAEQPDPAKPAGEDEQAAGLPATRGKAVSEIVIQ